MAFHSTHLRSTSVTCSVQYTERKCLRSSKLENIPQAAGVQRSPTASLLHSPFFSCKGRVPKSPSCKHRKAVSPDSQISSDQHSMKHLTLPSLVLPPPHSGCYLLLTLVRAAADDAFNSLTQCADVLLFFVFCFF